MADPELPQGSILLHIGPHKTGTTTLQAGLGQNRDALRAQGVVYPGELWHELDASMAVALDRVDPGRDLDAFRDRWHEMVDDIRSSSCRFGVLSSEFYSETKPERIGWLVDQLGPSTQIVVTLRPLARILTSQWQQYVQNRIEISWDGWLTAILADPTPGSVTPTFWRRHRHDLLIKRWIDVVGPDRLTVIAIDDSDPQFLLRSFERLLGVSEGTLTPTETRANRSLTLEEVELVRAFNRRYRLARFGDADYTRLVRYGAVRFLQQGAAAPADHRILLPSWAVDRVREISSDMIDRIASYGARVVGPLSDLADPALMPATGDNPAIEQVDPQLTARFVAGLATTVARIRTSQVLDPTRRPIQCAVQDYRRGEELAAALATKDRLRTEIADVDRRIAEQRQADGAGTPELIREIGRRLRRRLRRSGRTQGS